MLTKIDVFRKTMNFDVWQMVDPIKVGVGLSGTIASHKTLTLVVGMTQFLFILCTYIEFCYLKWTRFQNKCQRGSI
jgi:hypothetical protein